MNVKQSVESAAANVVSSSLASNGITDWNIFTGMGIETIQFPCVKIVCLENIPMYPELNLGWGKAKLLVMTCAVRTQTSASIFETVSDMVLNPFFNDNIASTMASGSNLLIQKVMDDGLDTHSTNDGWVANQAFQLVCGRNA